MVPSSFLNRPHHVGHSAHFACPFSLDKPNAGALLERVFANAISGLPRNKTRNKLPNYKAGPEVEKGFESWGKVSVPGGTAFLHLLGDGR